MHSRVINMTYKTDGKTGRNRLDRTALFPCCPSTRWKFSTQSGAQAGGRRRMRSTPMAHPHPNDVYSVTQLHPAHLIPTDPLPAAGLVGPKGAKAQISAR